MRETTTKDSPFWMVLLLMVTILFGWALACGMPFAALGALAALAMVPRDAMTLAGLGWLAGQAIGFGLLGYPLDAMTFAWGGALGLSALAAVGAALLALRMTRGAGPMLRPPLAFLAALAGQQGVVFLASLVLASSGSAFAPAVLWFILWTNALAFAVLLGVQWIGARAGLARPLSSAARA